MRGGKGEKRWGNERGEGETRTLGRRGRGWALRRREEEEGGN